MFLTQWISNRKITRRTNRMELTMPPDDSRRMTVWHDVMEQKCWWCISECSCGRDEYIGRVRLYASPSGRRGQPNVRQIRGGGYRVTGGTALRKLRYITYQISGTKMERRFFIWIFWRIYMDALNQIYFVTKFMRTIQKNYFSSSIHTANALQIKSPMRRNVRSAGMLTTTRYVT